MTTIITKSFPRSIPKSEKLPDRVRAFSAFDSITVWPSENYLSKDAHVMAAKEMFFKLTGQLREPCKTISMYGGDFVHLWDINEDC